jgi:hypothetical protein
MTLSVNKCVLAGKISEYACKLSYLPSGKPALSFVLVLERPVGEKVYRTFVPIQCYRSAAEGLAETLEPGDLGLVDGQLGWKADGRPQHGGKGEKQPAASLAVSTFASARLYKGSASRWLTFLFGFSAV